MSHWNFTASLNYLFGRENEGNFGIFLPKSQSIVLQKAWIFTDNAVRTSNFAIKIPIIELWGLISTFLFPKRDDLNIKSKILLFWLSYSRMRKMSVMRAVNDISSGGYVKEVSNLDGFAFPTLNSLSERWIIWVKLHYLVFGAVI